MMGETITMLKPSLADLGQDEWLARLAQLAEEDGYCHQLGRDHTAALFERGEVLLVTFDTLRAARFNGERALPTGFELAERRGWSHLTILAHKSVWFRDPAVYAFFDRLVDDDFLEDFDQVVFFGEGMCGYAAAAYSVAAPGATVLSLAPQATLDPRRAGWDHRFVSQRRRSFTDRYGYAPDMLEGCAQAFVVFDPEQEMDAIHASLFHAPQTQVLPCRFLGVNLAVELKNMGLLDKLLTDAMEGTLTTARFWKLYREARREHGPYLRRLLRQLDDDGRRGLSTRLCRYAADLLPSQELQRKLRELERSAP